MNLNEIFEVNELARIRAGKYAPTQTGGQLANSHTQKGVFPVYTVVRRRYDPSVNGMTSQLNTTTEYRDFAISGETSALSNSGRTSANTSTNTAAHDWEPMQMWTHPTGEYFASADTYVYSTSNNDFLYTSPPIRRWYHGGTYQDIDSGNYVPLCAMFIPVRNTTDTDIALPNVGFAATSQNATYSTAFAGTLTSTAENPTLTDTPTWNSLYSGNVSNTNNTAIGAVTIPAKRSVLFYLGGHFRQVKAYSNSYAWAAQIGPSAGMWHVLTNTTGLVPDINVGWNLLLNKGEGSNSFAGLFVDTADDLYEGVV